MSGKLVARSRDRRVKTVDLPGDDELILGRSAEADGIVEFEGCLSRRHARLCVTGDGLRVERLPEASNAIIFRGSTLDAFTMKPGELFVIGSTTFQFIVGETDVPCALPHGRGSDSRVDGGEIRDDDPPVSPLDKGGLMSARTEVRGSTGGRGTGDETSAPSRSRLGSDGSSAPIVEHTMSVSEMRRRGSAGDRMRLLDLMELPVVLRTRSRSEFYVYACGSLRIATGADWVQTVWVGEDEPIVLAEDARLDRGATKSLSRRLMRTAIAEAPKPVTYCWSDAGGDASFDATAHEGVGWAICCAMPVPGEEPVLFYAAGVGQGGGGDGIDGVQACDLSLRQTARLVGLVADMIGRAISMEKLEDWKSRLGQFFSEKVVAEILESDAEDALAPRIAEATVMFFDIRGFSARTEENFSLREEENLERILDFTKARRGVLNLVSQCVIDHHGVVISYAGDGLLACWNVPKAIAHHAESACLAAIEMTERIQDIPGGWRCGIGLGSGQIVAGSLGSDQKEQYDILGSVVNQSSRIEGITKVVGVQLLATEAVAAALDRTRILSERVARFRPAGMTEEVDLYTLVRTPDDAEVRRGLEERFAVRRQGLAAFEKGDWDAAFRLLNPIATKDPAAKYLMSLALKGESPRGWRGVIELTAK